MMCIKCGKDLVPEALFCAFCGQPAPKVEPEDERTLTRPKAGRVIRGVAAGMSETFGMPVLWLRIAWVVLSIATLGLVAILYLVLCFAIPEENEE